MTILRASFMHDNSRISKNLQPNEDLFMNRRQTALRFVLDTNVVMDLLHFNDVRTGSLRSAIEGGAITCFTDSTCFAEFARVTAYPAFGLDTNEQEALQTEYRAMVVFCEPIPDETYTLPRCRDPDDQKFLVLATRCQADALVTRDKMLLRLAHHRHKPVSFSITTAGSIERCFG